MAGAQQLLGFGCLPQLVRQRFIAALLHQPLAVALGASQWVGIAQVQPQRHRRIRRQRGEFMGRGEGQAVAVGLPLQAVVVGVGQQPVQGEATVIHAPQRQAQVLGGIELTPLQQKRLPDGIAGRHVMPLGQGPDQPSPHGLGRLAQQGQFTGLAGVDGQGQVTLLQAGAQAIGAVVPLPSGLVRRVLQLADGMRGHTAGCLHRSLACGCHAQRQGGGVEFDAPKGVFQYGGGEGRRCKEQRAKQQGETQALHEDRPGFGMRTRGYNMQGSARTTSGFFRSFTQPQSVKALL